jgi:hypothetical protein
MTTGIETAEGFLGVETETYLELCCIRIHGGYRRIISSKPGLIYFGEPVNL